MRAKLYRTEKKYDEALVLLERKLLQTVTRLSDLLGSLMEIALARAAQRTPRPMRLWSGRPPCATT